MPGMEMTPCPGRSPWQRGEVGPAGRLAASGCQPPSRQAPGLPGSGHPRSPSPRPLGHRGGSAARSGWRWGKALLRREAEENATFVCCSHLALAARGGGARGGRCARPRPPGIFERCSWVPGGWQTWQGRVGRAPKPTAVRGGGQPRGEGGTRQRLARAWPRRPPALWMRGVAQAPRCHCSRGQTSRRPGSFQIEATLFPCPARRRTGLWLAPWLAPSRRSRGPHPGCSLATALGATHGQKAVSQGWLTVGKS